MYDTTGFAGPDEMRICVYHLGLHCPTWRLQRIYIQIRLNRTQYYDKQILSVKLWIFLTHQFYHVFWVFKGAVSMRRFFEYPKYIL